MNDSHRRAFLKHAAGANERLTVGIIGCGGRGVGLAEEFAGLANVAYVCDPGESRRRRVQER
jgi:predicted dehydrogenase